MLKFLLLHGTDELPGNSELNPNSRALFLQKLIGQSHCFHCVEQTLLTRTVRHIQNSKEVRIGPGLFYVRWRQGLAMDQFLPCQATSLTRRKNVLFEFRATISNPV